MKKEHEKVLGKKKTGTVGNMGNKERRGEGERGGGGTLALLAKSYSHTRPPFFLNLGTISLPGVSNRAERHAPPVAHAP